MRQRVILAGAVVVIVVAVIVFRGIASRGEKLTRWERSRAKPGWKRLDLQDTGEAMFAVYDTPDDEIVCVFNYYKDPGANNRTGWHLGIHDDAGNDLQQVGRKTKASIERIINLGIVKFIVPADGVVYAIPEGYEGPLNIKVGNGLETDGTKPDYEKRMMRSR